MRSRLESDINLVDENELPEEMKFEDEYWADFKRDVSLQTLIQKIDRGIKTRMSLIRVRDNAEEDTNVGIFLRNYNTLKPINTFAIFIYLAFTVFEKPSWCINANSSSGNAAVETTGYGYWHCQDAGRTYPTDDMIKLPVNVTNITFIVCLMIMLGFTYARNTYRTPTKSALVAQKT
jgi:hypothetical protein